MGYKRDRVRAVSGDHHLRVLYKGDEKPNIKAHAVSDHNVAVLLVSIVAFYAFNLTILFQLLLVLFEEVHLYH